MKCTVSNKWRKNPTYLSKENDKEKDGVDWRTGATIAEILDGKGML